MRLTYDPKFPVSKLIPGIHRPDSWWQKHPKFVERQKHMIEDIKKNGLKYPLSVILKKNGKYVVTVGCQRLRAIKKIGWSTVPVIIASRGRPNPDLYTKQQVSKLIGCKIKRFLVQPNCCEIIPDD